MSTTTQDEPKKKRVYKKRTKKTTKKKTSKKTTKKTTEKQQTATRDEKGRFLKGVSGNPAGKSGYIVEITAAFKSRCLDTLENVAFPKLIKHLNKRDLKTHELMAIVTFLRDSSWVGKPKESNIDDINDTPKERTIYPIVIDSAILKQAQENDKLHSKMQDSCDDEDAGE